MAAHRSPPAVLDLSLRKLHALHEPLPDPGDRNRAWLHHRYRGVILYCDHRIKLFISCGEPDFKIRD